MAEFKIDGRMTVKKLKELFFKEFEGTLRVYNGRNLANDDATLASIRSNEGAKTGELTCRANRTVGAFEKEMLDVFGIKVQVATKDDFVLVLDGITLSRVKEIPKNSTTDSMKEFLGYQRQEKNSGQEVSSLSSKSEKVELDYEYGLYPVFDFKFKKVNWELNEENLEKHRDWDGGEYIDFFGIVVVRAMSESGDFETKVFADCDIVDSLYDAMEAKDEYLDDDWDSVEVYYTTVCEAYGAGESDNRGQEFGCVLSSFLGCDYNDYSYDTYDMDGGVICRAAWDNDNIDIWITDDCGCYFESISLDIDTLIEYKKNPASVEGKIEWVGMPKM